MPPQDDQVSLGVVGWRQAAAERECMSEVFVPVADFRGIADVRAAEHADEALDPVDAVAQRCSTWRGDGEDNRFGTAFGLDRAQALGSLGQRFFPADAHPTWIDVTFGSVRRSG